MKDKCHKCLHKCNCRWIHDNFCPLEHDGYNDNLDDITLEMEDLNNETI